MYSVVNECAVNCIVSIGAIDCVQILVSDITRYVSSGTLLGRFTPLILLYAGEEVRRHQGRTWSDPVRPAAGIQAHCRPSGDHWRRGSQRQRRRV